MEGMVNTRERFWTLAFFLAGVGHPWRGAASGTDRFLFAKLARPERADVLS